MSPKCPGQDGRSIRAESILCPACGYEVEMFSDEIKVKCPRCKEFVCKVRLPSCVQWCRAARECIGEEKWRKLGGGH